MAGRYREKIYIAEICRNNMKFPNIQTDFDNRNSGGVETADQALCSAKIAMSSGTV